MNRHLKPILVGGIGNTKSTYLINDYHKSIISDICELRDYCTFKGIDFRKVQVLIK